MDHSSPEMETAAPLAGSSGREKSTSKSTAFGITPQQKWAERNPLKVWCHRATESAIRRGLLIRPDKCDKCGAIGPVDAHHDPDRYGEPINGIAGFFCRTCHKGEHRRLKCEAVR